MTRALPGVCPAGLQGAATALAAPGREVRMRLRTAPAISGGYESGRCAHRLFVPPWVRKEVRTLRRFGPRRNNSSRYWRR